jgi:transcriptional regulator with XRE-family HTH domain
MITHPTLEELEFSLGEQLKRLRLNKNQDQKTLAARAGVSVRALRTREGGSGSTVKTLLSVVRALGREAWLETVAPVPTVNVLLESTATFSLNNEAPVTVSAPVTSSVLLSVEAAATTSVPATAVLPEPDATVNLLVATVKSPATPSVLDDGVPEAIVQFAEESVLASPNVMPAIARLPSSVTVISEVWSVAPNTAVSAAAGATPPAQFAPVAQPPEEPLLQVTTAACAIGAVRATTAVTRRQRRNRDARIMTGGASKTETRKDRISGIAQRVEPTRRQRPPDSIARYREWPDGDNDSPPTIV